MSHLRVRLLSPYGVVYEGEALSLVVPALKGPTYLCADSTSLQIKLDPAGIVKLDTGKGKLYFASFSGFANVKNGEAVVSCPLLEKGSSIDAARAEESKRRAEERLQKKQEGIDLARASASLSRALVRLEVKHLTAGGSI